MLPFFRLTTVAWCSLAILPGALFGQIRLSDIRPMAVPRGAESEVRFLGDRFDGSCRVICYTEGLKVTELVAREDGKRLTANVVIPEGFPMGWHAIRIVSDTGISDLRTIYVGEHVVTHEIQEPHGLSSPQEIAWPASIAARLSVAGEADAYQITAEEGQQISVEVQAMRAGRAAVDARLDLLDASGKVIATSDDTLLTKQDPFLSIAAPTAGNYTIVVSEARFDGSGRHWYLMHVGSFARPVLCDPPCLIPGQSVEGRLQLPNGEWLEQTIVAPSIDDTDKGTWAIYPVDEADPAPSPVFVRVSDLAASRESEPNNNSQTAGVSDFPFAIHGEISSREDRDFYRFAGKKGQVVHARVFARDPFRSGLDPILNLRDATGRSLGTNDDSGGPDSQLQVTLPADGEYLVLVHGQLVNKRPQESLLYRLEIGDPPSGIALTIPNPRQNVTKTLAIPRGNRAAILLQVNRTNTQGDIDVEVSQLPGGITHSASQVRNGVGRLPIVFDAAADADPAAELMRLRATLASSPTKVADLELRQLLTRGRNNVELCGISLRSLLTAVTLPAPFTVSLEEPRVELVDSGIMKLQVHVTRDEGFEAPVELRMVYNPPGVSSPRSIVVPPDKPSGRVTLTTNSNPRRGDWPIVITARATDNRDNKSRPIEVCTQLVHLQIAERYFDVTLPRASVEQGHDTIYEVAIRDKRAWEGSGVAELVGLPRGVTSTTMAVHPGMEKLPFPITATTDARPGQYSGIRCRITITQHEQPIVHQLGNGKLRVDRPLAIDAVALQE